MKMTTPTTDNYIDINLSATRKKRIRVDGDDNRILELNTSDINILSRLRDGYPKLNALSSKLATIKDIDESDNIQENVTATANFIDEVDTEMREILDFIFDANVSELCAPSGSMYDMFNGQYRFEIIIETLLKLYEDNINAEYKKMTKRVQKHTDKYIKG